MKIEQLLQDGNRSYSFEFFPPKDEISAVDFGINVGKLLKLSPSFVSVTYGAGGSTQERTFALVDYLQNRIGLTTMAHYTCVNASQQKVMTDLRWLADHHIQNLMLLRGDPPKGANRFTPHPNGFAHASELIKFATKEFNFCIGGASYPEKHPESRDMDQEITMMKRKVEAGCKFLVTQLFFDNNQFWKLIETARLNGITCPILPGIIPITAFSQIERFTTMSHTTIPPELMTLMEEYKGDSSKIYQIGMDFAIRQCRDLLMMGAAGLHFYTLNKSRATVEIFETLQR